MIKLDITVAMDLALLAIEERGADYVYSKVVIDEYIDDEDPNHRTPELGCVYWTGAGPSCAVGQVLAYAGINPDIFFQDVPPTDDHINWSSTNGIGALSLLEELEFADIALVSEQAACFLEHMQQYQDTNSPWGEAYTRAVQAVNKRYDLELNTQLIAPSRSLEELKALVEV